ncbi:uncharacterized protein PV06_00940 [Exophiala oligosperma]|uniref:RRM domain-containing protein n=2 Tax=Chaetothyriales TaxID=34395 RepID=A0A0D2B7Y0_9EURO|nr:uncharacterized protein PV06_00940 [Exophiala oligosperma]KAJ9633242.1 hypothetical protein H2204_007138 [Knufia peltigerae]KIW48341.1 hypothetical protein PV06_00940 [Exophiala oligosperma]
MASPSPPRGRSPARSATPTSARRVPSSHHSRSPTARRSPSPRSGSRSYSRSPPLRDGRNGHGRARSNGVSTSRSRSPSRGDRRSYRDRSYTRSPSRESRRAQSSKIVVEKLTKNVTEAHLREIFGSYGRIESIDLPLNKQFMTNRGTAYILYDHPTGSEAAIAHMHEAQLDGMVISVSIVLPRRAFSRSPPPARSSRPAPPPPSYRPPPRGPPGARYRSPPPRRGGFGGGHLRHRDDGGGLRPIQDHHREALQDVANHRVGVHHAEGEEVQATVPGAAIVEAQADRGVGQDIEDGGKAEMHLEAGGRYPKRA